MTPMRMTAVGALLVLLAAAGCSWLEIDPPFDVTGAYRGVWSGTIQGGDGNERACSMSLSLEHDGEYSFFRGFVLKGTATVYFTCPSLFDDIADAGLPARLSTEVRGYITRSGTITLVSVEEGANAVLAIGISGKGADGDEDGDMDALSGAWSLAVDVPDFEQISLTGTVEAKRT